LYTPLLDVALTVATDMDLIYPSYSHANDPNHENSRRVKNWVRTLMISGFVGFLLGNLF